MVRRCLWAPGFDADVEAGEVELDWEDVDLRVLATAYLEAMERFAVAHPPPLQVIPLRFRVRDKMREIYRRVPIDDSLPLLRDLHQRSDAEEVVVLFVAALELVRLGAVRAEQGRPFAEIYLRQGPNDLDLDALDVEGMRRPMDSDLLRALVEAVLLTATWPGHDRGGGRDAGR